MDYLAPRVLSCLVEKLLLESVVRSTKHCSCCLASNSSVGSSDHPLSLKFRKQNNVMLFYDPLGEFLVHFIYKISNLLSYSSCCMFHLVASSVFESLSVTIYFEVCQRYDRVCRFVRCLLFPILLPNQKDYKLLQMS